MSTKLKRSVTRSIGARLLVCSLLTFVVSATSLASPEGAVGASAEEDRSSVSSHTIRGGRDNPTVQNKTSEEYSALSITGERSRSGTRAGFAKPGAGSSSAQSTSFDFWIYDADVQLFNDDDNDGYFHGVDLLFDADTIYAEADVYAVLYLSLEGGPWNEYAVTEDFTILGSSGSDEYVLVTELMSGYPTGDYDLLIELFDVFDGAYVASYGPDETSALSFLPLEDFNRDAPVQEVVIIESHGGGGTLDGWLLGFLILVLLISASRKIWRHRNDALVRIDSPAPVWRSGSDSGR
jgi:hypothetical protein